MLKPAFAPEKQTLNGGHMVKIGRENIKTSYSSGPILH